MRCSGIRGQRRLLHVTEVLMQAWVLNGIAIADATDTGNVSTGNTTSVITDAHEDKPKVCKDTPGWTNGYKACNNYVPIDKDCHKDGVHCPFYKAHPHFCATGMNQPWMNCCDCGGGSDYNGVRPSTPPPPEVDIPLMGDLPGMKSVELELGQVEKKMQPLEKDFDEVYAGLNAPDYNAPPELEGSELWQVNLTVLGIIVAVAGVTGAAWALESCWKTQPEGISLDAGASKLATPNASFKSSSSRPPAWSTALLITSYVLLVPGLTQVIFSFNILVNVLGHRIEVQPEKGHTSCTETITGLVHLLEKTGSRTGAVLIILYAVVVPAVKLFLLAVGEALRNSRAQCCVSIARFCILIVQSISKWACPDMFAYILLVHLVRVLQHQPIILTAAKLDVGFSCFSVFCVCSTVSSLGITLPSLPELEGSDRSTTRTPLLLRCLGKEGFFILTASIAGLFVLVFITGLCLPCMALRIDERQLYPPVGSVPYSAKPLVESLAIPDLLKSDVSILSCTLGLIGEIGSGEANSIFALVMFGCCVVVLTAADVLLLLASAYRVRSPPAASAQVGGPGSWLSRPGECPFMATARVFRKLAMLDVSIMGVYVITFCLGIYKKEGIVVSTRFGLLVLIAAEVLHTLMYWIVSSVVESIDESSAYAYKAAGAEDDAADVDESHLTSGGSCCGLGGTRWGVLSTFMPTARQVTPNKQFQGGTPPA
eukprot:TRINITY_DN61620_c0_g1_i1.p1 TRINITY_DN61620_c0_g1~~TRINITY_DN61620_c0_g1_i1.p1  ORF type:complete len:711 (+),score=150.34 TRINITY_DN61620_c0_g1_i1:98-2230(+)